MAVNESTILSVEPTENPLSEREMDVARLLVTGASNTEIARGLTISPQTVKVHLRNVFEKLQVNSRTEASTLLLQRGWVVLPGMESDAATSLSPVATTLPEVEPLSPLSPQPSNWQLVYLLAAILVCIIAFFAPSFIGRTQPKIDLLTDASSATLGRTLVEMIPRWDALAPMLTPRSRQATVLLGNAIYVIGGESTEGKLLTDVERYQITLDLWQTIPPLPRPLSNTSAVGLNQHIYLAGGSYMDGATDTRQLSDQLLVYSATDQTWRVVGNLPYPLVGAALTSNADSIYLVGGWDGENAHDEIWRYTPAPANAAASIAWELVGRIPVARPFLGATVLKGKLYVVGGFDGQREMANADVFDLASGAWQKLPDLSVPRGGLSLVADEVAIYAIGGGWTGAIDTHERYDPDIGLWSNFASPIRGEWRNVGAVAIDGSLHLLGGWSGEYLDTHLRYESSIRWLLLPLIRN
ncbi:MAG: kelch repeat-containing protein [Caldilineaceae bacterium]